MDTATTITALVSPLLASGAVVALIASWWAAALPRVAIWGLFASLVLGQLVRLPVFGQGGGLLMSDIAVVVVLAAACLRWFQDNNHLSSSVRHRLFQLLFLLTPFVTWSLYTLLVHTTTSTLAQLTVSGLYWGRTTAYLLVLPALYFLAHIGHCRRDLRRGLVVTTVVLVVLGVLQTIFASDLSFLVPYGWDPHQHRLVSTWLDPNFIGAYFVIVIPTLVLWSKNSDRHRRGYMLLAVSVVGAVLLTQSRSSFVALAVIGALAMPFGLWRWAHVTANRTRLSLLLIGTVNVALVLILVATLLLGGRARGFIQSDPTVLLRQEALSLAWQRVAQPYSLSGVGYNAYQFATVEAGLSSGTTIHSRAGADNSWLTLWATTGILGMLLFAWPWVGICVVLARRAVSYAGWDAAGGLLAIVGLFVHSQFVNSFLYGHLLIALAIIVVLSTSAYDSRQVA